MKKNNDKIQYYSGVNGIKDLYTRVINSWKPKDTYFVVSAPLDSFKKLEPFFLKKVHVKRIKDKVVLKIIINNNAQSFGYIRKQMPFTQVKFLNVDTTSEYGVSNDTLFVVDYSKKPYGLIVKDENLANTFKNYFNILWQHGRNITIPPLIKSGKSIKSIILQYRKEKPIIITDNHNYDLLKGLSKTFKIVHINNNHYSNVAKIKQLIDSVDYGLIVGVGGCTALDVARACATEKIPCVLLPSILSTVCISVNKAVLNDAGDIKTFNTESPQKVIISTCDIFNLNKEMVRWARAGFGDLFAKIGASIDVVFRKCLKDKDVISLDKIRRNIPEVFDAIDYVYEHFNNYSKKDLEFLAVFLHEASVSIIIRDTFELSGGAEHNLAYEIEKKYFDKKHKPEHGLIVSVGLLIELRVLGELTGDMSLYNKMRVIFGKLGLPKTYNELINIGIEKKQIVYGIEKISNLNTLLSTNSKMAIRLIDNIFIGGKDEK